jgi:hypothetical protein
MNNLMLEEIKVWIDSREILNIKLSQAFVSFQQRSFWLAFLIQIADWDDIGATTIARCVIYIPFLLSEN